MREGLYESLKKYSESEAYPFHMPGHKRNPESGVLKDLYACDITEIDGFDNLHQQEGLIYEAQVRAAKLYGSEESYFLINGSTAGILSAVSAVAGQADKLIIARNCHKAVYNAAFLNRLELQYVYPEILQDYELAGEIKVAELEKTIKTILLEQGARKEAAADIIAGVVITSPTYDGISSDIRAIAELVHSYGLPLIVDQAHGAHFGLHPAFPENAVRLGADVVIHSVHKTLPAPTQTALIHRNGSLVNSEKLRKYLAIYQSSSPSYLLMAGIDEAVTKARQEGLERLETLLMLREELLEEVKNCRWVHVCPYTEPGKLVISVKNSSMTGQQLYDVLREKYQLQMEMASGSSVVAIITMMDTKEGFHRLASALKETDAGLDRAKEVKVLSNLRLLPEVKMPLWKAYATTGEQIEIEKAAGRTAADFVNLYPPGIPLIVPGESITQEMIEVIQSYLSNDYNVQGIKGNKIRIIR